jgi:RNA polymerase sigma-70 factor (ECF subfamily)
METIVPNEAELLESAQKYDRQALAQIYDLYSPALYRYALRLIGDAAQAEDCVAETFSRFLHVLRDRRGPKNYLQAYLYRTAHNLIADHYRKMPNMPEELSEDYLDKDPGPEDEFSQRFRSERIRAVIKKLSPDQQQVIALKYFEGLNNEEVAFAVGKPVGAVKSLQHRALARMQRMLEREQKDIR